MFIKHIIIAASILLIHTQASAVSQSKLLYGETGRLTSFDPFTSHEASGYRLTDLIFNSLVEFGNGVSYTPSLAEKWTISDDHTTVTLDLRKDVHWHDSSTNNPYTISANDVRNTVRLLQSTDSQIPNQGRFDIIESVEVINAHKVKITLKRATVDPMRHLTFKILPYHHLKSLAGLTPKLKFAKKPIGTGPYQFETSNEQGEVKLIANGRYYKGKPKIASMILKTYSDQSVMSQSLMFGSLDLVTYVSPRDLPEIEGDKRLKVLNYDALSYSFVAFNNRKGILKDKRVRQAFSYAINRGEMLEAFFNNKGKLITGPFPPSSWAYNLDINSVGYDPERAKKLLSDAGLTDNNKDGILEDQGGAPVKLTFTVPLIGEGETTKRIVLAYQAYLAQIGVSIELQFMDWNIWKKKVLGDHDYDLTIASWNFDDSANIYSLFHSSSDKAWGNNFVGYKNNEIDSLLTAAKSISDFDKKRKIYHKIHAVLSEESPYTFLWTLDHHAAFQAKVKGVNVEPFSFFKHVLSWNIKE